MTLERTVRAATREPVAFGNLLRVIDRTLCLACAAIVVAFTLLLVLQVALRPFDAALFWVEEFCQYLLIYLCFLGSAAAWGRRDHIAVEFMPEILTGRSRSLLIALVDVLMLVFVLWGLFVSVEFSVYSMRKTSLAMPMPVGVGYLGAPIGFALMALQTLIFMYRSIIGLSRVPPEIASGEETVS